MNTKVVVGLVAIIVVLGGAYAYTNKQKQMMAMEKQTADQQAMMEKEKMDDKAAIEQNKMEGDKMMENKDSAMMKKDDTTMKMDGTMKMKGSYEAYTPEKLAWANSGKVVLFFRASWCPTCKALDADIKAHMANIPEGVYILDVDYDNSAELKQKYGVTMQHTLVQVDAKGNMITKWSGGNTLDSVVKNLK